MVQRVEDLSAEQAEQLAEHARKWQRIAVSAAPADRAAFESAARRCYEHAQLPWHGNVVWGSSPLAVALAVPAAAALIRLRRSRSPDADADAQAVRETLQEMIEDGLEGPAGKSVGASVVAAVDQAVAGAPEGVPDEGGEGLQRILAEGFGRGCLEAIHNAVAAPVKDALFAAVGATARWKAVAPMRDTEIWNEDPSELQDTLGGITRLKATGGEAAGALRRGVARLLRQVWFRLVEGQLWCQGSLWWEGAFPSFFRDVCGLELAGDLWSRALAFEQTLQSAGAWYPHRDFLMVCERPREIHHELRTPAFTGGRSASRLHRTDGPAIVWADGWGVHLVHGRRVLAWIIDHPERMTVKDIEETRNAEVRRVMIERYGWSRYMADCGAQVVDAVPQDHAIPGLRGARLLRKELPGEPEPIVYLEMVNSTPEPDGSCRHYLERIDPNVYGGDAGRCCHAAMASRWHHRDENGQLVRTFSDWRDYLPTQES
jgi:hypothetical protein